MADDDVDEVIVCSAAMLFCASAYLFKFSKRQHAVWVKSYLQRRQQYGVYNILLADLAASDDYPGACVILVCFALRFMAPVLSCLLLVLVVVV